ncbi:MAG: hypothetical protein QXR76_05865 [Candidatus Bathyarchaeia archaeon]
MKVLDSASIAFLPFGTLAVSFIYESVPLRWACLASLLKTLSLASFLSNFMRADVLWSMFAFYAYMLSSLPVYLSTEKVLKNEKSMCKCDSYPNKVVFSELFKKVYNDVFSDYRISLLSKIPLAMQVVAAGSLLYSVFGLDWVMHSLAGFGIGAISLKAYKTAVNAYGYNKLSLYFGLNRFDLFKNERKYATLEWTLFCLVVVAVPWELMERAVYFVSPNNPLRVGLESVWNSVGDVIFGVIGGIVAWFLIEHKLHWT